MTALTLWPAACLKPAPSPQIAAEIRLGALAFNSPALLGGQAEKKGLSCGSCHQNGRGNPHFQFEAISGAPGTADVTSGLFSKARADNTFNPLPIPDLATANGSDQVDREDRSALAHFVRGQIEDEFSGDPPPASVFNALVTYLTYIDGSGAACGLTAQEPRTWEQDWADAQLAAEHAEKPADPVSQAFYTRTARIALRRLHDRYGAPEHSAIRERLIRMSRNLAAGQSWPEATEALERQLAEAAATSFYAPEELSRALARQP